MQRRDVVVIGGGPAGSAAALRLASAGASVLMIERGELGRDKVCGDGLTPRAIRALEALNVPIDAAHRTDGLRMIANRTVRELRWPGVAPFPAHGAAWQRRFLDAHLVEAAAAAGAEIRHGSDALPALEGDAVVGVDVDGERIRADLVVLATGATGTAARMVGAVRDPDEPFGLAIRTYAASPRHAERHLEACLTLRDGAGTPVPGYGWIFPLGDGTVNIGVGALSTMKGFRTLNLNHLQESYRALVRSSWELGPDLERPRAWRLPMSAQRRHGPGWVAVGDAAGLVNPMNGEGIDYALESGMLAADLFVANPATAPERYDREIGERFDAFLRTGRRFSFLVGHPLVLRGGLRLAVGTDAIASITLQVMGNLVDSATPGLGGRTMRAADRVLGALDPALRRFRAPA
ncbi:MAG TPA: geranylgeranyl reductase family protein [Microthrixaceae bacterium]|mgnify:FL=1|nr:geranylgeranyl reductase family protein [Microthrixaceae bacterium]HMT25701.1 geranylgeranyl reductase family protein [Microthrixaceae bacterium]HMT61393.1 geranylgeranyl reductase family protein [Microthrixaceae bacterium]